MKLLWLDLETTGLDPRECKVLEVAVMQAEFSSPFAVTPLYHAVIAFPPYQHQSLSPFILDMHTKNGLLAECAWAVEALHIEEVDAALAHLVPQAASREELPVLAGSSIHFDHDFIRVHLPEFAKRLSHRHYDVSAVKLFCESIGMPKLPKAEAHRAQADVLESIDHAQRCAAWVRAGWRNE
jgi:oligoribonuclease